jgi:hypothetical protein
MAKARKEGKPKRNRGNVFKNLQRIKNNNEMITHYINQIKEEVK